jgi:adenosine deaminase
VAFKNRGVVGFDLAGSEVNNPAKVHRQAFQLVIDNNINCTAHAGEAFGPDSVAPGDPQVRRPPHRPRHAPGRERRAAQLRQRPPHPAGGVPVVATCRPRRPAGWEGHPVDFFVDYGLRVTINTDNRLITDTTVSKELWLCHQHYGWSLETIKEVIIAGFKSAFMPYREKADLLAEISAELAKVGTPASAAPRRRGEKITAAPGA